MDGVALHVVEQARSHCAGWKLVCLEILWEDYASAAIYAARSSSDAIRSVFLI